MRLVIALTVLVGCRNGQGRADMGGGSGGALLDAGQGGAPGGGAAPDAGQDGVDASAEEAQLDEARGRWAAAKPSCQSYRYTREFSLPLSAQIYITTVTIDRDVPTERSFASGVETFGPDSGAVLRDDWDETGAQVGSHSGLNIAPPSTVEQLFDECLAVLSAGATPFAFDLAANGVPLTCSNNLGGDTISSGIVLTSFECWGADVDAGAPAD